MEGRWFTGGYDEIGMDVQLERVGSERRVLGMDKHGLQQGGTGQTVKIYGDERAGQRRRPATSISVPASP